MNKESKLEAAVNKKKSLQYTRDNTSKRAPDEGIDLRGLAPGRRRRLLLYVFVDDDERLGNTAPKKHRSGGDSLAMLCTI